MTEILFYKIPTSLLRRFWCQFSTFLILTQVAAFFNEYRFKSRFLLSEKVHIYHVQDNSEKNFFRKTQNLMFCLFMIG